MNLMTNDQKMKLFNDKLNQQPKWSQNIAELVKKNHSSKFQLSNQAQHQNLVEGGNSNRNRLVKKLMNIHQMSENAAIQQSSSSTREKVASLEDRTNYMKQKAMQNYQTTSQALQNLMHQNRSTSSNNGPGSLKAESQPAIGFPTAKTVSNFKFNFTLNNNKPTHMHNRKSQEYGTSQLPSQIGDHLGSQDDFDREAFQINQEKQKAFQKRGLSSQGLRQQHKVKLVRTYDEKEDEDGLLDNDKVILNLQRKLEKKRNTTLKHQTERLVDSQNPGDEEFDTNSPDKQYEQDMVQQVRQLQKYTKTLHMHIKNLQSSSTKRAQEWEGFKEEMLLFKLSFAGQDNNEVVDQKIGAYNKSMQQQLDTLEINVAKDLDHRIYTSHKRLQEEMHLMRQEFKSEITLMTTNQERQIVTLDHDIKKELSRIVKMELDAERAQHKKSLDALKMAFEQAVKDMDLQLQDEHQHLQLLISDNKDQLAKTLSQKVDLSEERLRMELKKDESLVLFKNKVMDMEVLVKESSKAPKKIRDLEQALDVKLQGLEAKVLEQKMKDKQRGDQVQQVGDQLAELEDRINGQLELVMKNDKMVEVNKKLELLQSQIKEFQKQPEGVDEEAMRQDILKWVNQKISQVKQDITLEMSDINTQLESVKLTQDSQQADNQGLQETIEQVSSGMQNKVFVMTNKVDQIHNSLESKISKMESVIQDLRSNQQDAHNLEDIQSNLEIMNNNYTQVQEDIQSIKQQVEAQESSGEELKLVKTQCKVMEDNLKKVENTQFTLENRISSFATQMQDMHSTNDGIKLQIQIVNDKLKSIENDSTKKPDIESLQKQIQQISEDIGTKVDKEYLEESLEQYNHRLSELQNQVQEQINHKENENNEATYNDEKINETSNVMTQKLDELREEINNFKLEFEQQQNSKLAEITSIKNENTSEQIIDKIQINIASLQANYESLLEQLSSTVNQEQLEQLTEQLHLRQSQLEEYNDKLSALENQQQVTLKPEVNITPQSSEDFELLKDEVELKIEAINHKVHIFENSHQDLISQMANLEQRQVSLESNVSQATETQTDVQNELQQVQDSLYELNVKVKETSSQNNIPDTLNDQHKQEQMLEILDKLQQDIIQLSETSATNKSIEASQKYVTEQIEGLIDQIEELKNLQSTTQNVKPSAEIEMLQENVNNQLNSLQEQLTIQNDQFQDYQLTQEEKYQQLDHGYLAKFAQLDNQYETIINNGTSKDQNDYHRVDPERILQLEENVQTLTQQWTDLQQALDNYCSKEDLILSIDQVKEDLKQEMACLQQQNPASNVDEELIQEIVQQINDLKEQYLQLQDSPSNDKITEGIRTMCQDEHNILQNIVKENMLKIQELQSCVENLSPLQNLSDIIDQIQQDYNEKFEDVYQKLAQSKVGKVPLLQLDKVPKFEDSQNQQIQNIEESAFSSSHSQDQVESLDQQPLDQELIQLDQNYEGHFLEGLSEVEHSPHKIIDHTDDDDGDMMMYNHQNGTSSLNEHSLMTNNLPNRVTLDNREEIDDQQQWDQSPDMNNQYFYQHDQHEHSPQMESEEKIVQHSNLDYQDQDEGGVRVETENNESDVGNTIQMISHIDEPITLLNQESQLQEEHEDFDDNQQSPFEQTSIINHSHEQVERHSEQEEQQVLQDSFDHLQNRTQFENSYDSKQLVDLAHEPHESVHQEQPVLDMDLQQEEVEVHEDFQYERSLEGSVIEGNHDDAQQEMSDIEQHQQEYTDFEEQEPQVDQVQQELLRIEGDNYENHQSENMEDFEDSQAIEPDNHEYGDEAPEIDVTDNNQLDEDYYQEDQQEDFEYQFEKEEVIELTVEECSELVSDQMLEQELDLCLLDVLQFKNREFD